MCREDVATFPKEVIPLKGPSGRVREHEHSKLGVYSDHATIVVVLGLGSGGDEPPTVAKSELAVLRESLEHTDDL